MIDLEWLPAMDAGGVSRVACPHGVALVSQTCDIVQLTRSHVVVAPLVEVSPEEASSARKGKLPLRIFLPHSPGTDAGLPTLAALDRVCAIPKSAIIGRRVLAAVNVADSAPTARALSARIGRAFTRFPFPDEVHPCFQRLRARAQGKAGTAGGFGRALEYVDELRVEADQWDRPGRRLTLHVVVASAVLIAAEDADESWNWDEATVLGRRQGERLESLTLARVSELIDENCSTLKAGTAQVDRTTVLHLWERWTELLERDLLAIPHAARDAVTSFTAELVSDEEFSHARRKRTESLDLEVLSDPR